MTKIQLQSKPTIENPVSARAASRMLDRALPALDYILENPTEKLPALLESKVVSSPNNQQGNMLWKIQFKLFRPQSVTEHKVSGTSVEGFISCHKKHFVAYSVHVGDQELWFDRFQSALKALVESKRLYGDVFGKLGVPKVEK